MFSKNSVARITENASIRDTYLSIEVRNVLALNDAAAVAGEDRFFYFSNPREEDYAPSLFTTEAEYGPLVVYERYKWSEEEKEEYWKHEEPERHCLMQNELSTIKLDNFVVPFLFLIPSDEHNYITWPNDTIAKAIMGIIDDEIYLGRRVDWELVALSCGRSRELYFDTSKDPSPKSTDECEHPFLTKYQLARYSLRAIGTNVQQCFKELVEGDIPKNWVRWSRVKEVLTEQGDKIVMGDRKEEVKLDGKQANVQIDSVPEDKDSDEERIFLMDEDYPQHASLS